MSEVMEFAPAERRIKSIEVEKTNFNALRIDFCDSFERTEEGLKEAMDMLVEAVCMIRDEIEEVRLEKAMRDQE